MKTLLTISLILIINCSLLAQFKAGLLGGINYPDIKVENSISPDLDNNRSFRFGIAIDYQLSKNFFIQTKPVYTETETGFDLPGAGSPEFIIQFSSLEIPVLFKYAIGDTFRPYITAGSILTINLSSEMGASVAGFQLMMDTMDITEDVNLGLTIGAGISYLMEGVELFAEGRFTKTLNPIYESGSFKTGIGGNSYNGYISDLPELKLTEFHFVVGFMLPVN